MIRNSSIIVHPNTIPITVQIARRRDKPNHIAAAYRQSTSTPDAVLPQALGARFNALGVQDRSRIHHRNRQEEFETTGVRGDLFEFESPLGETDRTDGRV